MVESLPRRGPAVVPDLVRAGGARLADPVAGRRWARLAPGPVTATAALVLNGFLILLADHELATSTLGARIAASTRANPYAVVAGALSVLDGPLHGTVSDQVVALLEEASGAGGPMAAIGSWLRQGRQLPGFGQRLYHDDDPRGGAIFAVGRSAGWVAHAIEEYAAPPLRFRGRALYTGPPPGHLPSGTGSADRVR